MYRFLLFITINENENVGVTTAVGTDVGTDVEFGVGIGVGSAVLRHRRRVGRTLQTTIYNLHFNPASSILHSIYVVFVTKLLLLTIYL